MTPIVTLELHLADFIRLRAMVRRSVRSELDAEIAELIEAALPGYHPPPETR
jgi:hypothetical protein